MELSLERYVALDNILPAFRFKDIQATVTILHWLSVNKFTSDELQQYVAIHPFMQQVQDMGYFNSVHDRNQTKILRDFERALEPSVRKALRTERLKRAYSGKIQS